MKFVRSDCDMSEHKLTKKEIFGGWGEYLCVLWPQPVRIYNDAIQTENFSIKEKEAYGI